MSEESSPFVSIIILNWNGLQCLGSCLDSVIKTDYPTDKLEIIVVDNASQDSSPEIARKYPNVTLIENRRNLGFCQGNNVGIKQAKGDILVLLNYDSYVPNNWLKELILVMTSDSSIGVAGSKILFSDGRVQAFGFIVDAYGRSIAIGEGEPHADGSNHIVDVDAVSGASAAFRRDVIRRIGLLDPFLFAYYDMPDFCERARRSGYRVVVAPSSVVYHISAHGWRRKSLHQKFLVSRNRIYFLLKHRREGAIGAILFGEVRMFIEKLNQVLTGRATFQKTGRIGGMAGASSNSWLVAKTTLDTLSGSLLASLWFLTIGGHRIRNVLRAQGPGGSTIVHEEVG